LCEISSLRGLLAAGHRNDGYLPDARPRYKPNLL
jgi:hypothetical protein